MVASSTGTSDEYCTKAVVISPDRKDSLQIVFHSEAFPPLCKYFLRVLRVMPRALAVWVMFLPYFS